MNIGLETAQSTIPQQPSSVAPTTTTAPFLPVCTHDLSSTFLSTSFIRRSPSQARLISPNTPYDSRRSIQTVTTFESRRPYATVVTQSAQQHPSPSGFSHQTVTPPHTRTFDIGPSTQRPSTSAPTQKDYDRMSQYPTPVFLPADMDMEIKNLCYIRLETLLYKREAVTKEHTRPMRTMAHIVLYDPATHKGIFKFVVRPEIDAQECARWTASFSYDQVERTTCYSRGNYYHTQSINILTGMKAFFSLRKTTNTNGEPELEARNIVFDY